jgi:hypothetical protein
MPCLARGRLAVVCAVSTAVHVGSCAAIAHAQDAVTPNESDACFSAAERAQPLMRQRHLREARVELEMCARDACPRVARSDCRSWLANVINLQPTIVIVGHEVLGTEVRDVHGIRATIDGAIIAENVDTTPMAIDPGPHRLRLEREGGDPLEQDVDIREGERGRVVHVYWRGAAAKGGEPLVPQTSSQTPPAVYILGSLGAAAASAGVAFEIIGLVDRSNLQKCAPTCNPDQTNSANNAWALVRVGDITLGAGIVLLAASAYIYFSRPSANTSLRGGNITWALGGTPQAFAAGLKGAW